MFPKVGAVASHCIPFDNHVQGRTKFLTSNVSEMVSLHLKGFGSFGSKLGEIDTAPDERKQRKREREREREHVKQLKMLTNR